MSDKKTILITGATDGIGFETAKLLVSKGHNIIIHGRNENKLQEVVIELTLLSNDSTIKSYLADLSSIKEVKNLASNILADNKKLDVIINNAGVFKTANTRTIDNLDVRFAVNTIAPYLLTKKLESTLDKNSRIVNLSSAAQAPVDLQALNGEIKNLSDSDAYAQSKLALTMYSRLQGLEQQNKGPMIVAVNPKSFLGSKMVKEAYGMQGSSLSIGANILYRAALSDEFENAHGKYYDNDREDFALPHPQALDDGQCQAVINEIESIIKSIEN